ncbi:hypothetical protein K458DRAFT_417029 [Lentithecium fluviatile CBS 122367]|uniref:Uncharacterized protein n=1 Tax=Lentithecium fluviatile CBS 122367 TaxID=1168545 RepID=A0A6G1J5N3_9PLEO|nr:hypothetical protein K458DRAFT_417029 [Lentithecium fluviatile CBS 122367]
MRAARSLFTLFSMLAYSILLAATGSIASARPSSLGHNKILRSTDVELPSSALRMDPRACTNAVANPSFESSDLSPWTCSATGSWASRDVVLAPTLPSRHSGAYIFHGHSNSTNASTITLSQININIPAGRKIDCSAWVYAGGDMGEQGKVGFDVFLDGAWCGALGVQADSGDAERWQKIGKEMVVQGDVHILAIVVMVDAMGEMGAGIEVGVDDVWVGWC